MAAKPGQIALRKFDHDEAKARYAAGESIYALAKEYGVVWAAVARVVRARVRKRMDAQAAARIERLRQPCRGGCGVLVWMHTARATGYCSACAAERRTVTRHGTEGEYGKGCRCGACVKAASDKRRERRQRDRVPCSHGCGTLVDRVSYHRPGKPPECHPCFLLRQQAARAA